MVWSKYRARSFPCIGNFRNSLVPRDSLPLIGSAFSYTTQWIFQTLCIVDAFNVVQAFLALLIPFVSRRIMKSADVDYFFIANRCLEYAAASAVSITSDCSRTFGLGTRGRFLLSKSHKRRCAPDCRCSPRYRPGRLEKTSTGEPALRAVRSRHFSS